MAAQDILDHKKNGPWKTLAKIAGQMVQDAEERAGAAFAPKLGGGTRLMLSLTHRISDDIDLFIRDPQWIAYLTPRLNDRFESVITGYDESATSLKFKLPAGEIDFIVGMSLLGLPDEQSGETSFPLEPVAEVLAKKLFYRGWALTPRDLFDWWFIETRSACPMPAARLGRLLEFKQVEICRALDNMAASDRARDSWNAIRAAAIPDLEKTARWGQDMLSRYAVSVTPLKPGS